MLNCNIIIFNLQLNIKQQQQIQVMSFYPQQQDFQTPYKFPINTDFNDQLQKQPMTKPTQDRIAQNKSRSIKGKYNSQRDSSSQRTITPTQYYYNQDQHQKNKRKLQAYQIQVRKIGKLFGDQSMSFPEIKEKIQYLILNRSFNYNEENTEYRKPKQRTFQLQNQQTKNQKNRNNYLIENTIKKIPKDNLKQQEQEIKRNVKTLQQFILIPNSNLKSIYEQQHSKENVIKSNCNQQNNIGVRQSNQQIIVKQDLQKTEKYIKELSHQLQKQKTKYNHLAENYSAFKNMDYSHSQKYKNSGYQSHIKSSQEFINQINKKNEILQQKEKKIYELEAKIRQLQSIIQKLIQEQKNFQKYNHQFYNSNQFSQKFKSNSPIQNQQIKLNRMKVKQSNFGTNNPKEKISISKTINKNLMDYKSKNGRSPIYPSKNQENIQVIENNLSHKIKSTNEIKISPNKYPSNYTYNINFYHQIQNPQNQQNSQYQKQKILLQKNQINFQNKTYQKNRNQPHFDSDRYQKQQIVHSFGRTVNLSENKQEKIGCMQNRQEMLEKQLVRTTNLLNKNNKFVQQILNRTGLINTNIDKFWQNMNEKQSKLRQEYQNQIIQLKKLVQQLQLKHNLAVEHINQIKAQNQLIKVGSQQPLPQNELIQMLKVLQNEIRDTKNQCIYLKSNLHSQQQSYKLQNQKLKENLTKYEIHINEEKRKNNQLQLQQQNLILKLTQANNNIKQWMSKHNKLETQYENIKNQGDSHDKTKILIKQIMKHQVNELSHNQREHRKQLQNQKNYYQSIIDKMANSKLESLEQQNRNIKNEYQKVRNNYENIERNYNERQKKQRQFQQQLKKSERMIQQLNRTLNLKEKQLQIENQKVKSLQLEIRNQSQNKQSIIDNLITEKNQLIRNINVLNNQSIPKLHKTIQDHFYQRDNHNKKVNSLQQNINNLQLTLDNLTKQTIPNLENQNRRIQQIRKENQQLKNTIILIGKQHANQKDQLIQKHNEYLQQKSKSMSQFNQSLMNHQNQIDNLKIKLQQKSDFIAQLTAKAFKYQTDRSQLQQKNHQINKKAESVSSLIEAKKNQILKLIGIQNDLENENKILKEQKQIIDEEIKTYQRKLQETQMNHTRKNQEFEQYKSNLAKMVQQNQMNNQNLHDKYQSLVNQLAHLLQIELVNKILPPKNQSQTSFINLQNSYANRTSKAPSEYIDPSQSKFQRPDSNINQQQPFFSFIPKVPQKSSSRNQMLGQNPDKPIDHIPSPISTLYKNELFGQPDQSLQRVHSERNFHQQRPPNAFYQYPPGPQPTQYKKNDYRNQPKNNQRQRFSKPFQQIVNPIIVNQIIKHPMSYTTNNINRTPPKLIQKTFRIIQKNISPQKNQIQNKQFNSVTSSSGIQIQQAYDIPKEGCCNYEKKQSNNKNIIFNKTSNRKKSISKNIPLSNQDSVNHNEQPQIKIYRKKKNYQQGCCMQI